MSYEPVADGELAAVVTYLEMAQPPNPGDNPSARDCPLSLRRVGVPQPEHYRELFRRIGSRIKQPRHSARGDPLAHPVLPHKISLRKLPGGNQLTQLLEAEGAVSLAGPGVVPFVHVARSLLQNLIAEPSTC